MNREQNKASKIKVEQVAWQQGANLQKKKKMH